MTEECAAEELVITSWGSALHKPAIIDLSWVIQKMSFYMQPSITYVAGCKMNSSDRAVIQFNKDLFSEVEYLQFCCQ